MNPLLNVKKYHEAPKYLTAVETKEKNTHLGRDLTRFKHSTDLVELFRQEFSFTTVLAENIVIISTTIFLV